MTKRGSVTFDNAASEATAGSGSRASEHNGKLNRGLFISPAVIFIYILSSIALAAAVGLIVHFAHPDRLNKETLLTCSHKAFVSNGHSYDKTQVEDNITSETCQSLYKQYLQCDNNQTTSSHITQQPPSATTTERKLLSPSSPVNSYRLPSTLKPYHYNVEIRPDFYLLHPDNFTFTGKVMIYLQCLEPTNVIVVNTKMLYIEDNTVSVEDMSNNRSIIVTDVVTDHAAMFLNISVEDELTVGQNLVVHIYFSGNIYNSMAGLYWTSYLEDGKTKYALVTQFEAADARRAFPCLDEPQLRATFNVSIWRKTHMTALSNMPKYHTEAQSDDWVIDHFEKTPVTVPTYLVAFAVANYSYVEKISNGGKNTANPKQIRCYSRPDFIAKGYADYACNISAPMFDFFEEYFNFTFSLPKTDQITLPDFAAGAMENWGLITYRETRFLIHPDYTNTYDIWRFTKTIGHEFLHQWLGNTVTLEWWSDLWLQEGAARYFENMAVQHARPEWNVTITYLAMTYQIALMNDQDGSGHPVHSPVNDYFIAETMFSSITYDKGSTVYRMIDKYIFRDHPEAFIAAMRDYVATYSYKNVEHDDLISVIDKHARSVGLDLNITSIIYTWIKQSGYPVVTFKRGPDKYTVHVSQKLFLVNENQTDDKIPSSPYGYVWDIPLSYFTNRNSTVIYKWMMEENISLHLDLPLRADDWFLGNYHQLGFYRVNYDDVTWRAIINQLQTAHEAIDVIHRSQILSDVFYLARAGETDQVHALMAAEYLFKEDHYLPWWNALQGMRYTNVIISTMPIYGDYRKFMAFLVEPNFKTYGWKKHAGLLHCWLQNMVTEVACKYGVTGCSEEAVTLFQKWMRSPEDMTVIHPDIRRTVYSVAIENDVNGVAWEFLFNKYKTVEHENERKLIRFALSQSMQNWILHRYFTMAATNSRELHITDNGAIMHAIARNYPSGTMVAMDYLHQHWENMVGIRYGILSDVIHYYSTDYHLSKFEDFTKQHPAEKPHEIESYNNMRNVINRNIQWRNTNEKKISKWLKEARVRQISYATSKRV